ncbi:MAG TPA: N-6 DNA methylase [Thermoguttaceae bacterium]|nr:N-6 DNA methylase [Thermoguttaceae bacterium]
MGTAEDDEGKLAGLQQRPRLSVLPCLDCLWLQDHATGSRQRVCLVEKPRVVQRQDLVEFPDLLGAAYEYLIGQFADSAGKKGGEFYTPRDVVWLMVRLLEPEEGMRIYDPCCGSGGMLIQSRHYIEECGGNVRNLRLYGQDKNGGVWAICKMNMILHGIRDADVQNEDTLLAPQHTEGGELMRFDRVITNPPFSQNYTRAGIAFPERFAYGFCPESGKKADLMFVQHMLAVLRTGGAMATVMPHGVLFRGGAEKEIRKGLLVDDVLEAVIGLPPNLFYGTGIPACILVCRAKGAKPKARRGKVLFVNADAEYYAGRAQNYLRPEHTEKIVSAYRAFADIPGYASVVALADLEANDFNLNIRRYADNAPPPEPHDVRAHLVGGVPKAEVEAKRDLFDAHKFDPAVVFVQRDRDYCDLGPNRR